MLLSARIRGGEKVLLTVSWKPTKINVYFLTNIIFANGKILDLAALLIVFSTASSKKFTKFLLGFEIWPRNMRVSSTHLINFYRRGMNSGMSKEIKCLSGNSNYNLRGIVPAEWLYLFAEVLRLLRS